MKEITFTGRIDCSSSKLLGLVLKMLKDIGIEMVRIHNDPGVHTVDIYEIKGEVEG